MSESVNETMARVLEAGGQEAEARAYYEKALHLAKTVEPAFQEAEAAALEKRLAKK